jgi:hypothetical protein
MIWVKPTTAYPTAVSQLNDRTSPRRNRSVAASETAISVLISTSCYWFVGFEHWVVEKPNKMGPFEIRVRVVSRIDLQNMDGSR